MLLKVINIMSMFGPNFLKLIFISFKLIFDYTFIGTTIFINFLFTHLINFIYYLFFYQNIVKSDFLS